MTTCTKKILYIGLLAFLLQYCKSIRQDKATMWEIYNNTLLGSINQLSDHRGSSQCSVDYGSAIRKFIKHRADAQETSVESTPKLFNPTSLDTCYIAEFYDGHGVFNELFVIHYSNDSTFLVKYDLITNILSEKSTLKSDFPKCIEKLFAGNDFGFDCKYRYVFIGKFYKKTLIKDKYLQNIPIYDFNLAYQVFNK